MAKLRAVMKQRAVTTLQVAATQKAHRVLMELTSALKPVVTVQKTVQTSARAWRQATRVVDLAHEMAQAKALANAVATSSHGVAS